MFNRNHGRESLDAILDELHNDGSAVGLLQLAIAEAKSLRGDDALVALAGGAFPETAEIVFQTFLRTLHEDSTNDE